MSINSHARYLIEQNKKTKYHRLDLGRCGLRNLPEEIFDCVWIEELIISNYWWDSEIKEWITSVNIDAVNRLSTISDSITKLTNLKRLVLCGDRESSWDITNIEVLGSITSLRYLDLGYNKIENPKPLASLVNLRFLNLCNNRISTLEHLPSFANLKVLDQSYNKVSDIHILQKLSNISAIEILNLCNNQISLRSFKELTNIEMLLDFKTNNIRNFNEGTIYLNGNDLPEVPPEVLFQGTKFVLQFLKYQNKQPLNECKIVITGRGGVGKTSFQKRLFGEEAFNRNESETHGIRKRTWEDGVKSFDGKNIKVHFWDMGGQQEQQTLHQLFYTEHCVYILLIDKRIDEDPEHFLELIKIYSNDSPVIIAVNNRIDLNNTEKIKYNLSPEFDSTLLDRYRNIVKVMGICGGQDEDPGILELKNYLKEFIPSLGHVRKEYPVEWIEIKEDLLEKIDENYIEFKEFEDLCNTKNLNNKELQVGLAKMLNDTGAVTYFDKPYLNYYILNPDWVTTGIYEIILSPITSQKKGRINFQDLGVIFNENLLYKYNDRDLEFLMKLMQIYDLCHEFKPGEEWLIPSSLKGQPKTNLIKYKEKSGYRLYCLKYDISLPQSIVHKFIARNIYYAYKEDYWRNGILLKQRDSNTFLFIEADYKQKEIRIWIRGKEVLESWKFFRKDFIDLSQKFGYEEMVELEGKMGALMSYKQLMNLFKTLKKEELVNWYNPDLDMHVDVFKTLVFFDDPNSITKKLHSHKAEISRPGMTVKSKELQIEIEKKELQFELDALKNKIEMQKEESLVRNWKMTAIIALSVSIVITALLFIVYTQEYSFIMSEKQWQIFKSSESLKWLGSILALVWNGIIIKIFYDRIYNESMVKAFKDNLKKKK